MNLAPITKLTPYMLNQLIAAGAIVVVPFAIIGILYAAIHIFGLRDQMQDRQKQTNGVPRLPLPVNGTGVVPVEFNDDVYDGS